MKEKESYELSWSLLVLFQLLQKTLNSMLSAPTEIVISGHVNQQRRTWKSSLRQ